MNKTIKIALAGMLAASSLTGVSVAQGQTMTPGAQATAPMAEGVSVVRIDSLNQDSTRGEYEAMKLKATDMTAVQEAQAEVQADPALGAALAEQNLELAFVIDVVTAADGSKIVYVQ